jgi:hypothetical protein
MGIIFVIFFYILWFVITGYIALNPRGAWELLCKWESTRYPSRQYFGLLRLFGILAFCGPLIWFITQFFK